MKPISNRIFLGAVAGILSAGLVSLFLQNSITANTTPVIDLVGGTQLILISGLLTGLAYALIFQSIKDGLYSDMLKGVLLGFFMWVVFALNIFPLIMINAPMWAADSVRNIFPSMLAHLLVGGLTGFLYSVLVKVLGVYLPLSRDDVPTAEAIQRVVILGGGYAGVAAAEAVEKEFLRDPTVSISLVSQTNYLLHTPMLSEVSASALDERHISPPLRSEFQRVQIVQGSVERIDVSQKQIYLAADTRSQSRSLPFDQLVITMGGVPAFYGNASLEKHALTLKSLEDAVLLRNQIIDMFERADFTEDPAECQAMLTFVVAGGGFAGVELIGGINDFARGMLPFYPNLSPDDVRMILVHSRDIILPELSPELGRYAQQKLAERGVEFVLNTRVTGATANTVELGEQAINTHTFVWTAGNRPSPILETLGIPLTQRGQLDVDAELAVKGLPGIWAAGDCAQVPDEHARSGFSPPTAQHALRQGKIAGHNVAAAIQGKPRKPFHFKAIGSLAALGHQIAVAEIMGYRFSGFLAWLMWRAIYLSKLPTLQKRVRVGIDWLVDLFFPPDIVQTINFSRAEREQGKQPILGEDQAK